MLIQIVQINCI